MLAAAANSLVSLSFSQSPFQSTLASFVLTLCRSFISFPIYIITIYTMSFHFNSQVNPRLYFFKLIFLMLIFRSNLML